MNLPGNCLVGAILIRIFKGGKIRYVKRKDGWYHFMVETGHQEYYHFTVTYDILPYPLAPFLFIGHFEKVTR